MSEAPPPGATISEFVMIAHMCGYDKTPTLESAFEIMKRCISQKLRIKKGNKEYVFIPGYGLAMLLLQILLTGGDVPFHTVSPIPLGNIAKVTHMCLIDPKRLNKEGITKFEDYFTMTTTISTENKKIDYPTVFGVCMQYLDNEFSPNWRCFLIKRTRDLTYPFIAVIPTDKDINKMIEICRTRKEDLTGSELIEWIETQGTPITKEETIIPEDFFTEEEFPETEE